MIYSFEHMTCNEILNLWSYENCETYALPLECCQRRLSSLHIRNNQILKYKLLNNYKISNNFKDSISNEFLWVLVVLSIPTHQRTIADKFGYCMIVLKGTNIIGNEAMNSKDSRPCCLSLYPSTNSLVFQTYQ